MDIKKLNIRPDTGIYGTYRRISYEPWTALAEFVDNSTQSFYDYEKELFSINDYKGLEIEIKYIEDSTIGDEIVIRDNAYGMDFEAFKRAIILNRPPLKTTGRNEFGMGLKAAACWFGNLWTVESTSLGSRVKYKVEIDVDKLEKHKNEEIDVEEKPANSEEHYTIVTIRKLNKKIKGKRIENKIRELLASTYRTDFRTGKIKIYYNGNLLKFEEVEPYIDSNRKVWRKEVDFSIPYRDGKLAVKGFIAIRIPSSTRNAGFTLLRRGRVIVGGPEKNYRPSEVFGPSNLYTWQRLYGELEMNDWPVTQAKDGFDWSNEDLEAHFIEKLVDISKDYRAFAETLRTREKVKINEIKESLEESLKNKQHISHLEITLSSSNSVIIEDDKGLLEDSEYDEGNKQNSQMSETSKNESTGVGVEIEENQPLHISMKYRNKDYNFEFIFDDKNRNSEWLKLETISKVNNEYRSILNILHSFFYPFAQKKDFLVVLAKFATALIIAEINSYETAQDGKISPSTIRIAMGQILEDFKNDKNE